MTARLEHANLSVTDVDAMLGFILAAFPEFRVRHDSGSADLERWVHVGDADTYIALNRVRAATPARAYFRDPEGAEWEFLQYLSTDKAQQNDYLLT